MMEAKNLEFKDKTILCVECGDQFIFTAGEQSYYYQKGLAVPKRCHSCRMYRRLILNKGGEHSG